MGVVLWTLGAILAGICFYLYRMASEINKTFARRKIPHEKPILFFGNAWKFAFATEFQGIYFRTLCQKYPDEPIVGYYDFLRPTIMVKDPVYIEKVLIKDFQHFVDRGFPVDEDANPLDISLFNLTGNRSCAFGLEPTHIDQPDTEYVEKAKSIFKLTFSRIVQFIVVMNFPKLAKFFGISGFTDRPSQNYFCGVIRNTLAYRVEHNIKRNDFIDLMLILKEKGHVEIQTKDPNDDYLKIEDTYTTSSFEITDEMLIGQAFIFLLAGLEATTVVINFVFYDLSNHPEKQELARQEIKKCIEKNGGVLDYESVKDMEYLDMCLKESMRLHSTLPAITRICTKKYTFPNGVTVEPGDPVAIPMMYVHMDPLNYPEPEKYDPERFRPGTSRNPCTYLPFGDGPRVCIAMRFAMLQMRFCVAKMLNEYRFSLNPKTKPLAISPRSFFGGAKEPFLFDLQKI